MPDHAAITDALRRGGIMDVTTTGRKSGEPRRIELVFHAFDDHVYISGSPGRRGWMANLDADPHMTFHLKRGLEADLPATARIISEAGERRRLLTPITQAWQAEDRLELFVADAPLIEVTFDDATLLSPAADIG